MAAARRIDPERLPSMRAAAQLLHRPQSATDPAEIARETAGIQAQDPYPARLSFRSRSRHLTAADIDRARTEERSLLRTWLMRMTIHMISSEDAGWMLPLFEPKIEKWARRRLDQLGMPAGDVRRAMRVIAHALEADGPMTRSDAAERVKAAGIELSTQTRMHIAGLAVTSGLACLGPDRGKTTCLVLREDWLGKAPRFDRDKALAELARRYLRGFGPATEDDFAKWSGLPLGQLRKGLEQIASELTELRLGEDTLLMPKGVRRRPSGGGTLRLLGAFDTYLLGYRSRDFSVAREYRALIKSEAGGGMIRPVIVHDGVVVGSWTYRRRGERVEVTLDLPWKLNAAEREAIDAEVADIERFEGVPVTIVGGGSSGDNRGRIGSRADE